MPLDKKSFWPCWSKTVAPLFSAQGVAWKGRDAKQGKIVRPDGRNILVSIAIDGRVDPDLGGDFLVGIAISQLDRFEEAHQFNVMPGAVGARYPQVIKRINADINSRVRDALAGTEQGQAVLAEHSASYLLRNPSSSSYRFRDECDLQTWAASYFSEYAKEVLEFARQR